MPVFTESRGAWLRSRRLRSYLCIGAIAALATGCLNPVSSALYQPAPLSAAPINWTDRVPMAVVARTSDGLELTGWFWAPEGRHNDILLFLPGRAGNRDTAAKQAEPFASAGRGVLVASYRGYGDNPGKPSEPGLYLDGAAFADLAKTFRSTGRLFLFGDGIGAAVALNLASRPDVSGTATLGAFDTFASFAPLIVRPVYGTAFDNVAAIRKVRSPVVIMHGVKDPVVPFSAAEKLRREAGGVAVVAPIRGEAYHTIDLRHVATTMWSAFDHMGANLPARPSSDSIGTQSQPSLRRELAE